MTVRILIGDVRDKLAELEPESVDCVITSPPFWGLRDYGVEGQLGMESTLGEHLSVMVDVFDLVRRAMKPEGVVFLNYGDCYATSPNGRSALATKAAGKDDRTFRDKPFSTVGPVFGGGHGGSCGSDGKAGPSFPDRGWTFRSRNGERKGSRQRRNPDSDFRLALELAAGPLKQIREHMASLRAHLPTEGCALPSMPQQFSVAILDCAREAQRAVGVLHDALASTKTESSEPPQGDCLPLDMISACRSSLATFSLCVQQFFRKSGDGQENPNCMGDSVSPRVELLNYIQCTDGYCSLLVSWLNDKPQRNISPVLKPKDLCMVANRLAIALQDAGWWVRSEIVWGKPNPMPDSSGRYRPSTAHEKVWLLSKSAKCFYDAAAVALPCSPNTHARLAQNVDAQAGSLRAVGKTNGPMRAVGNAALAPKSQKPGIEAQAYGEQPESRYLRNYEPDLSALVTPEVWQIATAAFGEAHFATFPPALVVPCILAGCPSGGLVLDPFFGAGTTGLVADRLGRNCIGIELNPEYAALAQRRIEGDSPMFAQVAAA